MKRDGPVTRLYLEYLARMTEPKSRLGLHDSLGRTALHFAAAVGDLAVIQELHKLGADLSAKTIVYLCTTRI